MKRRISLDAIRNLELIVRSNPSEGDEKYAFKYSPNHGITTFLIRKDSTDIEVFFNTTIRGKPYNGRVRYIPFESGAVISKATGVVVGERQAVDQAKGYAELFYANAE